jgi:serine/threonine protein kinase
MLGKGSFGEVFLVKKKKDPTGKLYAMKVLSKDKVMTKNLKRYALT